MEISEKNALLSSEIFAGYTLLYLVAGTNDC